MFFLLRSRFIQLDMVKDTLTSNTLLLYFREMQNPHIYISYITYIFRKQYNKEKKAAFFIGCKVKLDFESIQLKISGPPFRAPKTPTQNT